MKGNFNVLPDRNGPLKKNHSSHKVLNKSICVISSVLSTLMIIKFAQNHIPQFQLGELNLQDTF